MSVPGHTIERHPPAAQWIYRGLWRWLVKWMRVPDEPPTLPARTGQLHRSFQPSPGYLRYLKWSFWALVIFGGVVIFGAWVILLFVSPTWGIALTAPLWALLIVPSVATYVVMHLRYDTMWYVMTDRSLRIRRGIWVLHEVTITFENVQTVKVTQGPLQRWFGIGNVEVRTAGGGMTTDAQGGQHAGTGHHGVVEGVSNAGEIRDLILSQLRSSKSTGLGDEHAQRPMIGDPTTSAQNIVAIRAEHLAVLREIRDAVRTS